MAKKKEKSSVLPIIIVFILLIVCAIAGLGIYNHLTNNNGQSRVSNDIAEKDTQSRYLTIINDTDQIINEVHISVGEGTEIEHGYQLNPDEKSFSIKIPVSGFAISERERSVILAERAPLVEFRQILAKLNMLP